MYDFAIHKKQKPLALNIIQIKMQEGFFMRKNICRREGYNEFISIYNIGNRKLLIRKEEKEGVITPNGNCSNITEMTVYWKDYPYKDNHKFICGRVNVWNLNFLDNKHDDNFLRIYDMAKGQENTIGKEGSDYILKEWIVSNGL